MGIADRLRVGQNRIPMAALDLLKANCWGLHAARALAHHLLAQKDRRRTARQLVSALITNNPEQRVRAADVARRITEKDIEFLAPHAAALASILAETPIRESRARWHLGIVVARSARTPQQSRLAAEILWQLSEDKSNVVRCSAVEGLGLLARRDRSLRSTVEPYLHQTLVTGTPPCASARATHSAGCNRAAAAGLAHRADFPVVSAKASNSTWLCRPGKPLCAELNGA
jgi:hypothetical protein